MSIIVPTYNEVDNVERIVDRCLAALADRELEILVVDDDSPDRTWAVAEETYADDDRVRVVRRTRDRGLAQSVTEGFRRATHECCAVIDADLQHPPEKLGALVEALEDGADVAIGSRHVAGGGIENWSATRKLVSRGATTVARAAVPSTSGIADPLSGFFAVRREVVSDVDLDPVGYKILLEVLAKCPCESVVEVPYVFSERERGESKLAATQYQRFLEHVSMLGLRDSRLATYVSPSRAVRAAEFAAVGGVGVLVNMVVFLAAYGAGAHHLVAGVAAFLVAVNANFVGNWAITFDRPRGGLLAAWGKFHAVSLAGFLVYAGLLAVSIEVLLLPALLANAVAIGGSSVCNFLGSEQFAFASPGEREPPASTSAPSASD